MKTLSPTRKFHVFWNAPHAFALPTSKSLLSASLTTFFVTLARRNPISTRTGSYACSRAASPHLNPTLSLMGLRGRDIDCTTSRITLPVSSGRSRAKCGKCNDFPIWNSLIQNIAVPLILNDWHHLAPSALTYRNSLPSRRH